MMACRVIDLGRTGYREAWALQKRLADARGADNCEDTLLLVEHPHTYTLGSSGNPDNILLSPEELAARGIEVFNVDRGGDVTYHGPGQLVGYPIIKLPPREDEPTAKNGSGGLHANVIAYVRGIEQTLIDALAVYGIVGWRYPGLTGVWVGEPAAPAKIAAIGVRVTTRRVTYHGFALNINTDMSYFEGIIPCGITDKAVTSMEQQLGATLDVNEVARQVTQAFGTNFGLNFTPAVLSALHELVPGYTTEKL